jgi:hypothetical protein
MKFGYLEILLFSVLFLSTFIPRLRFRSEVVSSRYIQYILGFSLLAGFGFWFCSSREADHAIYLPHPWYPLFLLIHIMLTYVFVYYLFYYVLPYMLSSIQNKDGQIIYFKTFESLLQLQKRQALCNIILLFYSIIIHAGYIIGFAMSIWYRIFFQ